MSVLSATEQEERRAWFHRRFAEDVVFNRFCGLAIPEWTPERVRYRLPYAETLTSAGGLVHGGVLSALVDTAGCGAVMAGHDYAYGSRVVTVSLSVQFLAAARAEDVEAVATCTRRGRVSFADVVLTGVSSGTTVATGHAAYQVAGEHPDAPWVG